MKKIRNVIISISLVFFISIGMTVPKAVYASDGWGNYGDNITWTFTESTGVLELKGTGEMPDEDAPWDSYKKGIKEVIIGEGITSISRYSFRDYSELSTVSLPSSLKVIDYGAFRNCSALTSINLPENLSEIERYAFADCGLRYIQVKAPVDLPSCCFGYCDSLEMAKLEEGVKSINSGFSFCDQLKAIYVPRTTLEIEGLNNVDIYGYPNTAAWEYAGKTEGVNFIDVSTPEGKASWDKLWDECVNRGKQKGDVNQDGKIDLTDAQLALEAALMITNLVGDNKTNADVNGNDKVDLEDAQQILKIALGITS